MSWIRGLTERLRSLFLRGRVEADLDEELRYHLDREIEKNLRAGMDPRTARTAALKAFGGVERVKEQVRDERGTKWLEDAAQDVRFAFRSIRRSVGFAAVIVLTLGLGIGANTAIFSIVNGALLKRLPYGDGERLVHLRQTRPLLEEDQMFFSVKEIQDYEQQARTLDGVAEYHSMTFTLLGRGDPELVKTGVVSAHFFDLMGMEPVVGRGFTEADNALGAEPVLVLSHGYWMRRFGGDPDIVGQTFEMNDKIHTVVGVLPPVPQYPRENDVYMPTSACPTRSSEEFIANRNARMMTVFGRLGRDVTLEAATREVSRVASRLEEDYPESYPETRGYEASVVPLQEELVRRARPTFLILLGTAGFVLLIACANVANLALARMNGRQQELAVRTALGARQERLARQLLTESTVLALLGGGVGLLVAVLGLDLLVAFAARFTQRASEARIDGTVLLFTLGASLVTGLAFGALPALLTRLDLSEVLKEGKSLSATAVKQRLQGLLVVAQLSVAFVLLIGAGLLLRSFFALQEVDPGYRPEQVLSLHVSLPEEYFETPEGQERFFGPLVARIQGLPEVRSVARSTLVPMGGDVYQTGLRLEDRPQEEGDELPLVAPRTVSPSYFETLGIPLLAGRSFDGGDDGEATPVAVVSRTLVRRHWPDLDPLGRRLQVCSVNTGRCGPSLTVVGVVGDIRDEGLDVEPTAQLYTPVAQNFYGGQDLLVRTSGDPLLLAERVKAMIHEAEPRTPVSEITTLERLKTESLAERRLTAILLGLFAALALAVTVAGVAGVIAFSVSQRTREIGIRMALGAERSGVLGMVLIRGLKLAVLGLAIGAVGSMGLTRALSGLLWGIAPTDPLTFVAVATVFLVAALAASYLPARRATAVDPVDALSSS